MEASIHKKKCGVKRKNHKCGIGLCNADEEEEYEPPVKIANLGKLQAGEAKPKNHVQRRCRKCHIKKENRILKSKEKKSLRSLCWLV